VAPILKPRLQKSLIKAGYQLVSARNRGGDSTFMNYGYAPPDHPRFDIRLPEGGEIYRNSAQLYYHVASAVDLGGKDVLEVGSGRGGGSAFIKRQFLPRSVTGVDFASKAVSFCNGHYHIDGLSFMKGDAENLPCTAQSFDVVINVESSHCYPSFPRFLKQVRVVLRPRGYLLFADLRRQQDAILLRDQFREAGFQVLEEERITADVVHALELDDARSLSLIRQSIPPLLRNVSREFLGVKGSRVHEDLRTGALEYLRFVLRKEDR